MGLLRREFVSTSIAVALVTPTPSTVTLTFDAAVKLLRNRCPSEFLEAVRDTGAFLYRGEPGTPAILAHEWKALTEARKKYGLSWHWVSFARMPKSRFARAAVQIDGCGSRCSKC